MLRAVRKAEHRVIRQAHKPTLVSVRKFWVPVIMTGAALMVGSTIFKYINEAVEKSKARKAAEEYYAQESSPKYESDDTSASSSRTESTSSKKSKNSSKQDKGESHSESYNDPVNLKFIKFYPNCIGIDVGSSHSKAVLKSWKDASWNEVRSVVENAEGGRITPTALYISSSDDEFVVGDFAKVKRFSKPDHTRVGLHPSTTVSQKFSEECSRVLPMYFPDVSATAFAHYSPSTVLSSVLVAHMTQAATNKLSQTGAGKGGRSSSHSEIEIDPEELCINIGVCNSNSAKHNDSITALTRRLLGSDNIQINTVPDAVSAVRGAETLGLLLSTARKTDTSTDTRSNMHEAAPHAIKPNEFIVVVDVGGACTQLSILQWDEDSVAVSEWRKDSGTASSVAPRVIGAPVRVLERTLVSGCETINDLIVQDLAKQFAAATGIDLMQDPLAQQRLYQAAEQARVELCTLAEATISLPFITADKAGPKHLDRTLSRSALEQLSCSVLASIRSDVDLLLEDFARLGQGDGAVDASVTHESRLIQHPKATADGGSFPPVHTVILTGGGIRVPSIAADLSTYLTHKVVAVNRELGARLVAGDDNGECEVHVVIPKSPEELNCIGISATQTYK